MTATGYCSCIKCCGKSNGITASGAKASNTTIAADWNTLPKGTRVYIEGIGCKVVQDRGSAIQGNRIDVWCKDHATAKAFGVRTVEVRILD